MDVDNYELEPLELWFKENSKTGKLLPANCKTYFTRYKSIKDHLVKNIYPYIGAATSAEDLGIYTDHSIDHFNAVIRYAGLLLGLDYASDTPVEKQKISLAPYEIYMTLVSILLHDAGNINGRNGHEKQPLKIFMSLGEAVCTDQFEARPISAIARAHGGKVKNSQGKNDKDTIRNSTLKDMDSYQSINYRSKLIAALVRFSDEICEDRNRTSRFLINNNLPAQSEIYHQYANSITSVSVDLPSKTINIKYEITKNDVLNPFGKNNEQQYLIDEINERLEKMFSELLYCKSFMYEVVNITRIRATVTIYNDQDNDDFEMHILKNETFELTEKGYPSQAYSFKINRPDWCGKVIKDELEKTEAIK